MTTMDATNSNASVWRADMLFEGCRLLVEMTGKKQEMSMWLFKLYSAISTHIALVLQGKLKFYQESIQ